jgi:hypothetical protein
MMIAKRKLAENLISALRIEYHRRAETTAGFKKKKNLDADVQPIEEANN